MLYIVATPIGNLKDITLRALEVLQSVDGIICEDTRRTSLLLNHYKISPDPIGVKKPLKILNDFNESKNIDVLVNLVKNENWALVSDAGTPLISDPGYKLVRACFESSIEVDSIPGPSSVIMALTLSGLPPDKFMFLGYLPEKQGRRTKVLQELLLNTTYIIFIAPHKLIKVLEEIKQILGDIEVVLAHELTKVHQSVKLKKISQWLEILVRPKGEYVLLFNLMQ